MKEKILLSCLALIAFGCVPASDSDDDINIVIIDSAPDGEGKPKQEVGPKTESHNPPKIIETFPKESVDVEPNSSIQVKFDSPLDVQTINAENFKISSLGKNVGATIEYDSETFLVTIIPMRTLSLITTYTVSLGENIRAKNGANLVAHSWSFTVRDVDWSEPEVLQVDQTQEGFDTKTAVNNEIPTVLWSQYSNFRGTLWTANFIPGLGWQTAEQLEWHYSEFSAHQATLVEDGRGNMMALWSLTSGGTSYLAFSTYRKGEGWGEPQLNKNVTSVEDPTVAFDNRGNAIIAWGGNYRGVRAIYVGAELVDLGYIAGPLSKKSRFAQVKFDKNGDAIVCWDQKDEIWAARFDKARLKMDPSVRLDTGNAKWKPKLISGDEGVSVVWAQNDGIYTQQFTTKWENKTKAVPYGASFFKAKRSSNGNILLLWWAEGIRAKLFHAKTQTWGDEVIVDSDTEVRWPELAVDKNGNAFATWHRRIGSADRAWFARYSVEKDQWSSPEKLVKTGISRGVPTVGFLEDGTAVASFGLFDGDRTLIVGLRFD